MGNNPLVALNELGQSIWLDTISRELIDSGKLRSMVEQDALTGVTSNPTIFQKAISGSSDYDSRMKKLRAEGVTDPKELFIGIAVDDIGDAADILKPVYERTGGMDGYVSIEVSPDLAYDTQATIEEAVRLFDTLKRDNVLVKVPATKEGVPAIEELIARGVNVNVTLLFSVDRYRDVMDVYLKGLERRAEKGESISSVASVASFFVSRVDTLVDKKLDSVDDRERAGRLRGKIAVANSKIAFQAFREVFGSERFRALEAKGAKVQRLLWGSTGTKDPDYSDIKYVEELMAPVTINTLPMDTINAFRDHGNPHISIEDGLDEVPAMMDELRSLGIDIDQVTGQLEDEGVKKFADSFNELLGEIKRKSTELA